MPHRRASRKVISLTDNSLANDDEGIRPNRFIMKRYRPHTHREWRYLATISMHTCPINAPIAVYNELDEVAYMRCNCISGENRLFKTISIFAPRFQID